MLTGCSPVSLCIGLRYSFVKVAKRSLKNFSITWIMNDSSEQKPLLSKSQNSDDNDGVTAATHSESFCGDFRNPSSRCHRFITLVIMCFLSFGKLRSTNSRKKQKVKYSLVFHYD